MNDFYVSANLQYDYPRSPENKDVLARATLHLMTAFEDKYGQPMMTDAPGPCTWGDVTVRAMYPEIPLGVWRERPKIIAPIPYDVLRFAHEFFSGRFPAWCAIYHGLSGKSSPKLLAPGKEDEGIALLRFLTEDFGTPPNRD